MSACDPIMYSESRGDFTCQIVTKLNEEERKTNLTFSVSGIMYTIWMNIYFMGLILHMYTQSIIGSDHEWKVEVPPCVGEPMLWCDKLNNEQDESCTGSGIHIQSCTYG